MKFYGLRGKLNEDVQIRVDALRSACETRDIEYVDVNILEADFANPPVPERGDILFQVAIGPAKLSFLMVRDDLATVFTEAKYGHSPTHQLIPHEKAGIPMPRTIHRLTKDPERLAGYVEACGGFPVVLKARGGTHGVGVMKIDSMSSLVSVLDYVGTARDVVMRQMIKTDSSERLVVLGDKVVASYRYHRQKEDIRANAGNNLKVEAMEYPAEMQETAVAAVHALGVEFGGVDMLLDSEGNHYVLEANTPFCNFGRAIEATGIAVGDLIVEYLHGKAQTISRDGQTT